ncbi:MAG TPA: efflux RND transporter periplasmic adaptor subunit, partial [bacterium]|nr:efflux RND transporter periplasmic adaptor subunit [bacterium]
MPKVILLLFFALITACGDKETAEPSAAEPAVQATKVIQRNIPNYVEYVGQTEAPVSVEIRARVEGFIQEVAFVEGSEVKEGDLLFVIDPKPYEEKLARAKGKLAEAQANFLKAHGDVERFRPLAKIQAIAQRDFDTAVALEQQAQAVVDAAQADVKSAELDVSYTTMRAPVSGRIGSTMARVGALVGKGEPTLLATISNTDQIWVSFGISEVEYLQFAKKRAENPGIAGQFKIELILADGSVHAHPGRVNFADRSIDPKTGTLRVRVEFPNPNNILRPGQFGRVRVLLEERADALVVPVASVQEIQGKYSVMLVDADSKAVFRPVKPGLKFEGSWVIEEGVKVGDLVVVEGLKSVKDGMKVQAKEIPFP